MLCFMTRRKHLPRRSSQMYDELVQQRKQIDLDCAVVDGGGVYCDVDGFAHSALCNVGLKREYLINASTADIRCIFAIYLLK